MSISGVLMLRMKYAAYHPAGMPCVPHTAYPYRFVATGTDCKSACNTPRGTVSIQAPCRSIAIRLAYWPTSWTKFWALIGFQSPLWVKVRDSDQPWVATHLQTAAQPCASHRETATQPGASHVHARPHFTGAVAPECAT